MDTGYYSHLYIAITLLIIVFINSCFIYYFSFDVSAMGKELDNFTTTNCKVIRESGEFKIDSSLLVPGDIIKIKKGDRIPADIRIIESVNLKVNNVSLTGQLCD